MFFTKKEKSQLFYLGETPAKLVEAGDNRNNNHNLSQKTMSDVVEAMRNPIAVRKAEQNKNEKTHNNRYSDILDLKDGANKYVLVALDTDKRNGK